MKTCKNIIAKTVSGFQEFGFLMNISFRISLGMLAFAACLVLPIFGFASLCEWLETINIL